MCFHEILFYTDLIEYSLHMMMSDRNAFLDMYAMERNVR